MSQKTITDPRNGYPLKIILSKQDRWMATVFMFNIVLFQCSGSRTTVLRVLKLVLRESYIKEVQS